MARLSPDPARLADLFDAAAELPEAERAAFVAARCGAGEPLRAALARLLAHDQALTPAFLHAPALAGGLAGPDLEDLADGTRVGRLVILRKLGEGGMGSVYAAYDEALGREVAVKRLHHGRGGDREDERMRTVAEARILARLSHPNIVQVHEIVETADQILLVMELVDGVTLRAWAAPPRGGRGALGVIIQAGPGLAAPHAFSIVHRDFKPDNVMLGADGRVRILDFGLALLRSHGRQAPAGTPAFMAPEQLLGRDCDARSDQFSYCLALYTCLFGQAPFARDDLAGLLAGVDDPPRPPPPAPGVTPRLAAAVLRGLAREPADRWPDMDALLAALAEEAARDPEVDLDVARRQRRALVALLICLGVAIDVYIFVGRGDPDVALTAGDLVRLMSIVLAVILALVAALWRALRRNRINRQLAALLVASAGFVWLHRAIGLRLGAAPTHTLIGDLLLLGACSTIAALTLRREFAALAAVFLTAALLAAYAPGRAPELFSLSATGGFVLALLWWRRG